MKITTYKTQTIEKEIPFDINELIKDLQNYDYFDPTNPDDWNYYINEIFDIKYSQKELKDHKDVIIKFMQERRKNELESELDYYLEDSLCKLKYDCNLRVTEEEIHKYISDWFNRIEE